MHENTDVNDASGSMQKKLPILHVGFPKCGSTTLQMGLFARHPQVASLGEPHEDPDATTAMHNAMWSCHQDAALRKQFDLNVNRVLWMQAIGKTAPQKTIVFSKETLTHSEFYSAPGDSSLPEKLYALVGPARIVIMARHQIKLIESLYITRTKGPRSYQTPEQWCQSHMGPALHIFRFHAMAQAYATVFGRENVAVYLLEELGANTAEFSQQLCRFAGIDPIQGADLLSDNRWNVRTSARRLAYARLRQQIRSPIPFRTFFPKAMRKAFFKYLEQGKPARVALPSRWRDEMQLYYRDDNRQLAADWNLPLDKYCYPM